MEKKALNGNTNINVNMKRFIIATVCCLWMCKSQADEGMWLPNLLKALNEKELAAAGCKLTPEQIYSVNSGSLKDAIVQFGGGCTGEVISGKGLVLTNHHCGFSQIQSHSSLEHNYIKDGFWAASEKDELPNSGLTVTFIRRIEDVTKRVMSGISENMKPADREKKIAENCVSIEKEMEAQGAYQGKVRSFFYGNEYYLFITETFRDVRLVGAPPESIGNFGGDEDNWIWPRHTGDFSLFRIYADKNNKPADYSPDNVPYKAERFLPISLKGIKEGDFTMVFGFPGRTQEYIHSEAASQLIHILNPIRISAREVRLNVWDSYMRKDPLVKIQYASKYNRLSNYYKKWKGESAGLERIHVVESKQAYEKQFSDWLAKNPEYNKRFGTLMEDFKREYAINNRYASLAELFNEAASGIELLTCANYFYQLAEKAKDSQLSDSQFLEEKEKLKTGLKGWFKNYEVRADKELALPLLNMYLKALPADFLQNSSVFIKGLSTQSLVDNLYETSAFTNEKASQTLLEGISRNELGALAKDPAFVLWAEVLQYNRRNVLPVYIQSNENIAELNRNWMQAQRIFDSKRKFYPDANSTLRVSFGNIKGYEPKNAVFYKPFTDASGITEKSKDTAVKDYRIPYRLKELIEKKDFGKYAENGKLPVAFCAANHTTGGNSGSPVLNANGELIGTNFDRNWEGTMSDIKYDPDRVRNIVVDVRYTLFIIDKYAQAGHLLQEMNIVQ